MGRVVIQQQSESLCRQRWIEEAPLWLHLILDADSQPGTLGGGPPDLQAPRAELTLWREVAPAWGPPSTAGHQNTAGPTCNVL